MMQSCFSRPGLYVVRGFEVDKRDSEQEQNHCARQTFAASVVPAAESLL
jgi:hypothetical protein